MKCIKMPFNSIAVLAALLVCRQAYCVSPQFLDFELHDVTATPVYTWRAVGADVTATVPQNDSLLATFQLRYIDTPGFLTPNALKTGPGTFSIWDSFLWVEEDPTTLVDQDDILQRTTATFAVTVIPSTFTLNPGWATRSLSQDIGEFEGAEAEYQIELVDYIANSETNEIEPSNGALAGGAATAARTSSAGVTYSSPTIHTGHAQSPPGPIKIYAVSTAGANNEFYEIKGFNDTGYTFGSASSDLLARYELSDSQEYTRFDPSVTFQTLWQTGASSIGQFSSGGNVWTIDYGIDELWFHAWFETAAPPVLPADGQSAVVQPSAIGAGARALWVVFDLPTGGQRGFLLVGVPEPTSSPYLAWIAFALFGPRRIVWHRERLGRGHVGVLRRAWTEPRR